MCHPYSTCSDAICFHSDKMFWNGAGEKDLVDENKKTIGQKADCEAKIHKLEAEVGNLKIQVDTQEQKAVAASAANEKAVLDKVRFWTVSVSANLQKIVDHPPKHSLETFLARFVLRAFWLENVYGRRRLKHK